MFSDTITEITGFDACPESEKLVNDNSCQTTDIHTSTQETQTTAACSSGVQVSPDTKPLSHPYDADKLLKFLNRVMPHLEEELKSFDNLNLNGQADEDDNSLEQGFKQTVIKPDFSEDKIISSLAWSATGMMLAVGCSKSTHDGWCCDESSVRLYNTGRSHFEKQPEQVLKVSSCVKCLEFHCRIPSLLAGGLHSGEVIIWDLKHDEEMFVMNKKDTVDDPPHADTITTVKWRENESGLWLVTAGRDGRIVQWKVNLSNLTFEVHERYIILKQHLMTTAPITEHLDILQIDFVSSQGSNFLTAAFGGAVFLCSLTAARPLTGISSKDPIIKSYKLRKGIVTSVSCSIEMFACAGTDLEIHIFNYEQESPILRIHAGYPVLGVCWSSLGSFIYWGESKVDHYVINARRVVSTCLVCGISSATLKTGSFRSTLAVGDSMGTVWIITDWA